MELSKNKNLNIKWEQNWGFGSALIAKKGDKTIATINRGMREYNVSVYGLDQSAPEWYNYYFFSEHSLESVQFLCLLKAKELGWDIEVKDLFSNLS